MLRRIAESIDPRSHGSRQRRSVLYIGTDDFLSKLRTRRGSGGGRGYGGWDITRIAEPAFWSVLLMSQRRERFAMQLLGQVYADTSAVQPYVEEKLATQEILDAISGIDAESLGGFVAVAVAQFLPEGVAGEPLVPREPAFQILKAALLRGAMTGELRPDAVRSAWLSAHQHEGDKAEAHREWKRALGSAESLYRAWQGKRKEKPRRLI